MELSQRRLPTSKRGCGINVTRDADMTSLTKQVRLVILSSFLVAAFAAVHAVGLDRKETDGPNGGRSAILHTYQAFQGSSSSNLGSMSAERVRGVLDRYCVSCHNMRLKSGNLMLDQVDVGDIAGAVDLW